MKARWLVAGLALVLMSVAAPAFAQDGGEHTVQFDQVGFTFGLPLAENVNITQFAGDPVELEAPGGPQAPHTQFLLYNGTPAPESLFDGVGLVAAFPTANFVGYTEYETRLAALQSLLDERPDLAEYMTVEDLMTAINLPFLPVFPAAQVIRARAHYVETPSVRGVAYVTVFRQDASPFVAGEFLYTFQGLSTDGSTYIAAIFPVTASVFPAELGSDFNYDQWQPTINTYMNESIAKLNEAGPADFTPSLDVFDQLINSLTVGDSQSAM